MQRFAASVYDVEAFPNCFMVTFIDLWSDAEWYFEISEYRDDRVPFWQFCEACKGEYWQLGFNNLGYDYLIIHFILSDLQNATPINIYNRSMQILSSQRGYGQTNSRPSIPLWQRYIKQIDLYKIHHFDNVAKSTSLKALEVNMRSESIMESPVPFGTVLSRQQVAEVAYYNRYDTAQTKKFALISMPMIEFRFKLQATLKGDVLSFNDTKIGKQILEQRLSDVAYDSAGNIRQTTRRWINLGECVFPYIRFTHPEFQRVHSYILNRTITETKDVLEGLEANVNGFIFKYGTGGIHGSVERAFVYADDRTMLRDIDVTGLYPSIAIANRLYPEHLGERFIEEYAKLKAERQTYAKGTTENGSLKLASNGAYGDSNNKWSFLFDSMFTMKITINGQLLLSMLAEWLMLVPTVRIIQINTDGITYMCDKQFLSQAIEYEKAWQKFTMLDLEDADYSRMWIRDVNNYVAEYKSGKIKKKGAYWTPDKFPDDIQNASPTAWYRNYSADIVGKAAVANMVKNIPLEETIYGHTNMFDFMLRQKTRSNARLMRGNEQMQKVTRYFISKQGLPLTTVAPPAGPYGQHKPKRGVSDAAYQMWHASYGNVWNPAIHTGNKSTYQDGISQVDAGYVTTICNHVKDFDWHNLNYEYYLNEARKLVIR